MLLNHVRMRVASTPPWRFAVAFACLGFLLALSSVNVGLELLDDPIQRDFILSHLEGRAARESPWWDVFNLSSGNPEQAFVDMQNWWRPWWSWPQLKIRFFRPVAVATQYFDYAAFGDRFRLAHLHSAAWFGAACFVVTLLLLHVSSHRVAAVLASLLYTLDDAHATPIRWLAGRNALIAVTFAASSLLFYSYASRIQKTRFYLVSSALFVTALLSAENITSFVPFFILYALLLDERPAGKRIAALAWILIPCTIWYLGYRALGFGSVGSGSYLDPVRDRSAFWSSFWDRYVWLLRIQFGAPHPLRSVLPAPWPLDALEAAARWILLPALVGYIVRNVDRNRELTFWCGSAALGLVPLTAAAPHERLVTHVGIGLWMVLALAIAAAAKWLEARSPAKKVTSAAAIATLLLVHGVAAPIALVLVARAQPVEPFLSPSLGDDPALAERELLVVNSPTILTPYEVIRARVKKGMSVPRRVGILGASEHEVEIIRTDDRTIELSSDGYLLGALSNHWRGPSVPLHAGYTLNVGAFEAMVLRVTPDGRPKQTRFTFPRRLEETGVKFVYWSKDGTFRDFPLLPVGRRWIIPAIGDSTASMSQDVLR